MNSKIFFLLLIISAPAEAALRTVATTPDVAWLLYRVGGSNVEVKTLAKSGDNYHFLDARPDFILAVNRAAVFCRVGAELEIGWVPKILEKAANEKVMPGSTGDCDLSKAVSLQEKPTSPVDRSMGDVHASGNPHFWLSPKEMAKAAQEVETKLALAMPEKAVEFAQNRALVEKELNALQEKISQRLKPLQGKSMLQYHKDFSYLFTSYGIKSLGSIEEIPGISPSAARLGKVSLEAKAAHAYLAIASPHDPKSSLSKFQELSGVPVVNAATSLTEPEKSDSYAKWQESLADILLSVRK